MSDNKNLVSTIEGRKADEFNGYIRAKVESSNRIQNGFGIYININDHYELPPSDNAPDTTQAAVAILSEQWMTSIERGQEIANRIAGLGDV